VKANDTNALAVINQVKPIYVNFSIPEQSLPDVRKYMAAGPIAVEVVPPDPGIARVVGQLIFIDNAVDPTTGTIKLRARFDNAEAALWPGQFVNVSLRLYDQIDAITVPSTAVQTGPEGQYVYVVGADSLVDIRKVTVQRADGDRAIIAAGLTKGERVVTRGQLRLGPKTRVEVAKPAADPS
jgi:multidrug efflux system membrane fusion protein